MAFLPSLRNGDRFPMQRKLTAIFAADSSATADWRAQMNVAGRRGSQHCI